jgi:hypothetical protein
MPTKEEQKYRSSTWWDVRVYCLEVGKAHNGYCVVHSSPNLPEKVKKSFYWSVNFYPYGRSVSEGYRMSCGDYMPHVDYAAVTDLLMFLIYTLDNRLTEEERRKLTQSRF